MISMPSRFIATAASVVALLGVCSVASAYPGQRHGVRRLEAKLHMLQGKEQSELHAGRRRAAARTQRAIDHTRAEIRAIRH
jgi:hypothetical protein